MFYGSSHFRAACFLSLKGKRRHKPCWENEKSAVGKVSALREQIEDTKKEIERAKTSYDLSKAAELQYGKLPKLEESLRHEESALEVKDRVSISLAHTNANYDIAKRAFDLGASHALPLFNAMPPYTHRAPGVVGAVCDSPWVGAELIADGVHIHPAVVRASFRMMGAERMILISDSMRATGMPDGTYTLGGLDVIKDGKCARLASDGAIAGSVTNLADCMRTAVREMGLPLELAVRAASCNPAREMGMEDRIGSIAEGLQADFLLLDKDLNLEAVYKAGRRC